MKDKIKKIQKKKNKGFTMVELLVVITIIGVLSSFVSVGYFGYVKKSKESVAMAEAQEIYKAIEIGIASEAIPGCVSVADIEGLPSQDVVELLSTICGMDLPDNATVTLKAGVLTYTSRGVIVSYDYGKSA